MGRTLLWLASLDLAAFYRLGPRHRILLIEPDWTSRSCLPVPSMFLDKGRVLFEGSRDEVRANASVSVRSISGHRSLTHAASASDVHTYYARATVLQGVSLDVDQGHGSGRPRSPTAWQDYLCRSIVGFNSRARRADRPSTIWKFTRLAAHRICKMHLGLVSAGPSSVSIATVPSTWRFRASRRELLEKRNPGNPVGTSANVFECSPAGRLRITVATN